MRTRFLDHLVAAFAIAILLAAIAHRAATGPIVESAQAHSTNPDHISVIVGPGRSDTVTSTPFDSTPYVNDGSESGTPGSFSTSYGEDDCGHSIDYCHHHISSGAEWSLDIDSDPTSDDDVYLSVMADTNYFSVTNYVFDITPLCDAGNPRGYTVWVEVWAQLLSDQQWHPLGIVTYGHVNASVSIGGWYWPGTKVGDAATYTNYTGCWEGAHVHMDAYNYVHKSEWTTASWRNASVTYSSYWGYLTALGFLGGDNDSSGPDSHGGRFIGW